MAPKPGMPLFTHPIRGVARSLRVPDDPRPKLDGHGRQGVGMLDMVMLILTIVSFGALFAFVAWLERV